LSLSLRELLSQLLATSSCVGTITRYRLPRQLDVLLHRATLKGKKGTPVVRVRSVRLAGDIP
jgi:hypothetical protein